ncbi:MAG: alpha/beta hydrolase [Burkholderiales bacterium]
MNIHTERLLLDGAAGPIECAIDAPAEGTALRGVVVLAHPHPLHGGTLDNKVVQTMARAFTQLGYRSVRFNFRGVGQSAGTHDEGRGETDDLLVVAAAHRAAGLPLALGGFSFGAWVTALAAQRLTGTDAAERLLLVGPSTQRNVPPPVPEDTLVIHGESDDVVPLAATLDWARPQHLPVTVMPGVGHFFHGQLATLRKLILRSWH